MSCFWCFAINERSFLPMMVNDQVSCFDRKHGVSKAFTKEDVFIAFHVFTLFETTHLGLHDYPEMCA